MLLMASPAFAGERNLGFTDQLTPDQDHCFCRSFRMEPNGTVYDLIVADTGERRPADAMRENVLSVSVTARDGSLKQQFAYDSSETPSADAIGPMAWLDDLNFDGYDDLMLCTARGTSNEFSAFCLWNPQEARFDPMMPEVSFDPETERFSDETAPLELVNYALQRPRAASSGMMIPGRVVSAANDGYAAHTKRVYQWDSSQAVPALVGVFDVYDAGDGMIGERMYAFSSQAVKLWEHRYPSGWYYETDAFQDHADAADRMISDDYTTMRVAHADWVHLREMNSRQSSSLARLNVGTEVTVLKENTDDGWTLVLWETGEKQEDWFGTKTAIGYIRHSFLIKE